MTFAPRPTARLVIEMPEAGVSWSSRMTFAPCARHCSACDRCFCGSARALRTFAATPALLNAAFRYGASKSVYRVEDFVSGNSAHTWIDAADFAFGPLPRAEAPPAIKPTRRTAAAAAIVPFVNFVILSPPMLGFTAFVALLPARHKTQVLTSRRAERATARAPRAARRARRCARGPRPAGSSG